MNIMALLSVTQHLRSADALGSCPAQIYVNSSFPCHGTGSGCKHIMGTDVSSATLCCASCAATSQCALWTYQPESENGQNCYLKALTSRPPPAPHHCNNCTSTSGVMSQLPSSPPPPPAPTPLPRGKQPRDFKNVLFIAVDDLRPEIGAYGHSYMHTPHIDALAKQSTIFTRAYVQYAFCGPSRNSFMVSTESFYTNPIPAVLFVWIVVDG